VRQRVNRLLALGRGEALAQRVGQRVWAYSGGGGGPQPVLAWCASQGLPVCDGAVFARNSVAWYSNAGSYVQAAINEARIENGFLLIEGAITNPLNNNNTGQSGTSFPTQWTETAGTTGVNLTVVGAGSADPELGLPYTDIRFSGTPGAAPKSHNLNLNANSFDPITLGNPYTASYFMKLVAGQLPNNGMVLGVGTHFASSTTATVAGEYYSGAHVPPSSNWTRLWLAVQSSAPSTNFLKVFAEYKYESIVSWDFTVRFAGAQLEPGTVATSPVIGGTDLTARAADSLSVSGCADFVQPNTAVISRKGEADLQIDNWDGTVPTGKIGCIKVYAADDGAPNLLVSPTIWDNGETLWDIDARSALPMTSWDKRR